MAGFGSFGSVVGRAKERIGAQVKIILDSGQFTADIRKVKGEFEAATGGMSTSAKRVQLATMRYNEALAATGAQSKRTLAASIALDGALESQRREEERLVGTTRRLTTETDRFGRSVDRSHRSLGRVTRGAIAGSGVFKGLGRMMAFASGGFLGATGFVYGARAAVMAASDLNEQLTKTQEVFRSSSDVVEKFARNSLGLSTTQALEAASTIGALLKPLGVVESESASISTRLTQLGVDLASFYNTSVQDALDAIQSALVGQVRPLRRYGAEVSAAREKEVALLQTGKERANELTRQERLYARLSIIFKDTRVAQGDFLRTSEGLANQLRIAQSSTTDIAAAIGEELEPAVLGVIKAYNDWASNGDNVKELQKQIGQLTKDATKLLGYFADALGVAKKAVEPFVDELGGVAKTLEIIATVWLGKRLVSWAARGFGALAASSRAAAVSVTRDAAQMEAALDVATRPRNIIVTTTPVGMPPKGGGGGGGGGRIPSVPPILTSNPALITAAAVLVSGGASGARTGAYDPKKYPNVAYLLRKIERGEALTDAERAALAKMPKNKSISELTDAQLAALNRDLPRAAVVDTSSMRKRPTGLARPKPPTKPSTDNALTRDKVLGDLQKKELEMIAAQRNETLSDDIRIQKEVVALTQKLVKVSEGKERLDAQKDLENAKTTLYDLEKTQSDRARQAAEDRERDRKRRAAEEKRREAEAARKYRDRLKTRETNLENAVDRAKTLPALRKAQAALIKFFRAESKDQELTAKERAGYEKKALQAQRDALRDRLALREQLAKNRVEEAKADAASVADDIAAQKKLVNLYKAFAKRKDLTVKEVQQYRNKAAKAQQELNRMMKKDTTDKAKGRSGAEYVQFFLRERADFFSTFGSNVFRTDDQGNRTMGSTNRSTGSRTVVVNQHFTSPPQEPFRFARMMKFALEHDQDG
jgi:hypothetical protein